MLAAKRARHNILAVSLTDVCPALNPAPSFALFIPSLPSLISMIVQKCEREARYVIRPRLVASSTSSREPLSSPLLSFSPCLACPSLVRLLFDRGARRKIRQSATAKENDVTGPAAAVSFWIRRSVVPSLSLSLPPPPK